MSSTGSFRRSAACRALAIGVICAIGALWGPATPAGATDSPEMRLLTLTNNDRAANGLGGLAWDAAAASIAESWSQHMAAAGALGHNPNLSEQISAQDTSDWSRIAENVGHAGSVDSIEQAFMGSAVHRANILGDFNRVGIGIVTAADGSLWVTVDFVKAPPPPAPPAGSGTPVWFLRDSLTTGVADYSFTFGDPGDVALACDFDGDGIDTPAVYRNGTFYLSNAIDGSGPITTFRFGDPGDIPLCGDWTGSGRDSIGIFRNGTAFLASTPRPTADIVFHYGDPGDLPVAGDWDGDGHTTLAIYRNGTYFLSNALGGFAQWTLKYGDPGDLPVAGDWDGNGTTTIGIFRNGSLFLKNANTTGIADYVFGYGDPGDHPVIGHWTKGSPDRLGVVR